MCVEIFQVRDLRYYCRHPTRMLFCHYMTCMAWERLICEALVKPADREESDLVELELLREFVAR